MTMNFAPPDPAAPALHFYLLPTVAWIPEADLERLAIVSSLCLAECARDYGLAMPSVALVRSANEIPSDGCPVTIQATIDQPEDLAYHALNLQGRPYAIVLAPSGTLLDDVGERVTHELKEGLVDPFVDRFVKLASGNYVMREVCDPCQRRRVYYSVSGVQVATAAHVLPSWFDFDPEIEPGGYAMVVTPEGKTIIEGEGPVAEKRHPAMRHGKQLVAAHNLAMRLRLAA